MALTADLVIGGFLLLFYLTLPHLISSQLTSFHLNWCAVIHRNHANLIVRSEATKFAAAVTNHSIYSVQMK